MIDYFQCISFLIFDAQHRGITRSSFIHSNYIEWISFILPRGLLESMMLYITRYKS